MSRRGKLSRTDLRKLVIGGAVALAGAGLTIIAQAVSSADFGVWTPLVVAGAGVVVNAARKLLSDAPEGPIRTIESDSNATEKPESP